VTEAAARLRAELDRAQAIIGLQRAVNAVQHDPGRVMEIIATAGGRLAGATAAIVELVDGDSTICRTANGTATDKVGVRIPMQRSLSGLCVRSREPLCSGDVDADPRVDPAERLDPAVQSMAVVPLATGSRCHGVLKLLSDRPAAFGPDTVASLATLADHVATSLARSRGAAGPVREADSDALTGLLSRTGLIAGLSDVDEDRRMTVFCLGLDGLDDLRETRGRAAADAVLRTVANAVRNAIRPEDTIARVSADEFVVLGPRVPAQERPAFIRRLRDAVVEAAGRADVDANVGAVDRAAAESPDALLERANAAMLAKSRARDRSVARAGHRG
jgi:diguanylate cyclase (GGDEF)-like protein